MRTAKATDGGLAKIKKRAKKNHPCCYRGGFRRFILNYSLSSSAGSGCCGDNGHSWITALSLKSTVICNVSVQV